MVMGYGMLGMVEIQDDGCISIACGATKRIADGDLYTVELDDGRSEVVKYFPL